MDNKKDDKNFVNSVLLKLKKNKFLQYLIVIIIAIVAAFVLFGNFDDLKSGESTVDSVSNYVDNLESRLKSTLSQVDGAGRVSVVITVESGMETVLATETVVKETATGKETVETPIIVNGKTVVLKEMYPKITGVLIVAEGADSIAVLSKIQQATMSLLDIKINQIEILTMK